MALAVHALQEQINAAKLNLKAVDENIKKITGRDPNEPRGQLDDGKPIIRRTILGRRNNAGNFHRQSNEEPPSKRPGSVFRRLTHGSSDSRVIISRKNEADDEEETSTKPTIQSSVVSTAKKITKTELIDAQNVDEKGKARNKRMFGMLLGTLSRFQDDQKRETPQMKQVKLQKQIEQRLEEESAENRRKVMNERKMLFTERKMQRKKIELLEQKVTIAAEQEDWKKNWLLKKGFIMTKAKPEIFYLPSQHDDKSKELLEETGKRIQEKISQHEKSVQNTMNEIDVEIASLSERLGEKKPEDAQKSKIESKTISEKAEESDKEEVDLNKVPTDDIKVESQASPEIIETENVADKDDVVAMETDDKQKDNKSEAGDIEMISQDNKDNSKSNAAKHEPDNDGPETSDSDSSASSDSSSSSSDSKSKKTKKNKRKKQSSSSSTPSSESEA